jgi:DNA-binding LacI/PurR family transcriptional regulator
MAKKEKDKAAPPSNGTSLKALAQYLHLSQGTVSLVINRSPSAAAIPQETQTRILEAAKKLNYRANFFARSLRSRRSFTIGILHPDLSDYVALVMGGIEQHLLKEHYFYFAAGHGNDEALKEEYPRVMMERSVEGIIAIDTRLEHSFPVPIVTVSGHQKTPGITRVTLDHRRAAELAIGHLVEMGHREIAFTKGPQVSSDTEQRWQSICEVAKAMGVKMKPELCVEMEFSTPFPDVGYPVAQKLLARGVRFTALFAYNDVAAIGAIRALCDAGLRVPEDVAVIGFDDIPSAAFQNPSLTTVRQPLRLMGETAARILIDRLHGKRPPSDEVVIEPEFVIRESTTSRLALSASRGVETPALTTQQP